MELTTGFENKKALQPYADKVRKEIRVLMTAQGYQYDDLVTALETRGVLYSSSNLRNKIAHGALPASLYVMLLDIMKSPKEKR